jgi:hypothetical protein
MTEADRRPIRRFSFRTIEKVIVAATAVILAGLVVPTVRTWRLDRQESRARADLVRLREAMLRFMSDVGGPPTRGRGGRDGELLRLAGPGVIAEGSYFEPDRRQGYLEDHLVRNHPCGAAAAGYPGWRGPYLDRLTPDPWGFAYVVVAYPLLSEDDRDCIAVSAGRNGVMDGSYASARDPLPAGDDLIEVILDKSPERRSPVR